MPDDTAAIREAVSGLCDEATALVLVTGGTGFAPRDVTPEALAPLYDRRVPGIDEAMRAASMAVKPHGMLTRGVSGIRGRDAGAVVPRLADAPARRTSPSSSRSSTTP